MTDDMAAADVAKMPNVKRLLAAQGTSFADAVDSFPLCCPARATFITGQYAHNHGVKGNFYPYGWYGMKDRGNILPAWLQKAGYTTALIGKWLNGYGARDAHGEVPKGFDIWRGLLDVSAYDYFNFVMNRNGRLKTWGDADFARKLVEFAKHRGHQAGQSQPRDGARAAHQGHGPAPLHLLGNVEAEGLLARRDRQDHRGSRRRTRPSRASRSSSGGRRPPRTARTSPRRSWAARDAIRVPRRATTARSSQFTLPRPPSFNEADLSDKPSNVRTPRSR